MFYTLVLIVIIAPTSERKFWLFDGGRMKVAVASDHAGYMLKSGIKDYLEKQGIAHQDYGTYSEESVDYVDFAEKAMDGMRSGECDRAILVCGTGIGMGIVANKYSGVRAAPCCDAYMAQMSRNHNDANCLTLGGRILPLDEALLIVETWLNTIYEAGRHQVRLDKVRAIERKNFKF
jgi:ribose 5-phosphate isomerase B